MQRLDSLSHCLKTLSEAISKDSQWIKHKSARKFVLRLVYQLLKEKDIDKDKQSSSAKKNKRNRDREKKGDENNEAALNAEIQVVENVGECLKYMIINTR